MKQIVLYNLIILLLSSAVVAQTVILYQQFWTGII
jgi:hypothetical protein